MYDSETWFLLGSMAKRLDGTHTEFLKLITEKRARRLGDRTWETPWIRRTRGRGNAVGKDLQREMEGNCGAVGGATSLICGVCKGDRLLMKREK